jgi:HEPN domain-containing protein
MNMLLDYNQGLHHRSGHQLHRRAFVATQHSGKGVETTLLWLRWGDTDYRAARLLLMAGILVQGAALANTAIEKYLKSLFRFSGIAVPYSHKVSVLYAQIKKETSSDLDVNESFLRLIEKAYSLRYPEPLDEGFNIALNQARLLAELDRTVRKITDRFQVKKRATGKRVPLVLERAIQDQDEGILANNVGLNASLATGLFSGPSRSYDLRLHKGVLRETDYSSASVKDTSDHELEGFKVVSDLQFQVAYLPILDSPNSASVDGLRQSRVDNSRDSQEPDPTGGNDDKRGPV